MRYWICGDRAGLPDAFTAGSVNRAGFAWGFMWRGAIDGFDVSRVLMDCP
jgi:hypothetical protein